MSVPLPALVRERMQGEAVARCVPAHVQGYSSLSTRYAVVSDGPGIYVYDSGGILGSASVAALDGEDLGERLVMAWVSEASMLLVQAWLEGNRVVGLRLQGEEAAAAARALAEQVPVSVELGFRLDRGALAEALVEEAAGDEALASAVRALGTGEPRSPEALLGPVLSRLRTLSEDHRALLEHLFCGEVHAGVAVRDARLLLGTDLEGGIASIPCHQLTVAPVAERPRAVELSGSVIAAGFEVDRLVLHLPDAESATALRQAIEGEARRVSLTDEEPSQGPTGLVVLSGVGPDGEVLSQDQADAVLGASTLELRASTGQLLHAFDLEDAGTAVQGTAADFVLLDGEVGPLVIRPASAAFQARLAAHAAVAEAARRAADHGPYVGRLLDGSPVALAIHEGEVLLGGPAAPGPLPVAELDALDLRTPEEEDLPRLVLTAGEREVVVVAGHDMLEGMANHLRAANLALAGPGRIPALCEAMASLELGWLLHTAFGDFVQAHRHLGLALGGPEHEPHRGLPVPEAPEAQVLVLTWLSEGLGYLRHRSDLVRHALPGFVDARDARLLGACGLAPRAAAPALRQALAPVGAVAEQLERIEREVAQLDWLEKALGHTRADYAGLALRLGTSLINPFALVGAAAKAYSIRSTLSRVAASEAAGMADASRRCVREWNHLVCELLPALVPEVEAGAAPLRHQLRLRLLDHLELAEEAQRAGMLRALTHRFARLENFHRFPAEGAEGPRSDDLALLRRLCDEAPALPFKPF